MMSRLAAMVATLKMESRSRHHCSAHLGGCRIVIPQIKQKGSTEQLNAEEHKSISRRE